MRRSTGNPAGQPQGSVATSIPFETASPDSQPLAPRRARVGIGLFALALACVLSGCASSDDRLSERPWNTPKSWETGLPSGMMDERR